VATLRKNISGSIEGEAIQNDITGAKGTPLKSNPLMIGITLQEQNGLNAPTAVARRMAITGLARKTRPICFETPDIRATTAKGIVTSR
jgi:hypothetical protein